LGREDREEPWLGKMLSKGRSWEKEYLRQEKILWRIGNGRSLTLEILGE
jgi:hypothetical protein